MQQYFTFSEIFWCESLSTDLEIWYDNVEHEPENGIFWEFEWEALDSDDKDRADQMTDKERRQVMEKIRDYLRFSVSDYDD